MAYLTFEDRPRFVRIRFRRWTTWGTVWRPFSSGICLHRWQSVKEVTYWVACLFTNNVGMFSELLCWYIITRMHIWHSMTQFFVSLCWRPFLPNKKSGCIWSTCLCMSGSDEFIAYTTYQQPLPQKLPQSHISWICLLVYCRAANRNVSLLLPCLLRVFRLKANGLSACSGLWRSRWWQPLGIKGFWHEKWTLLRCELLLWV